MHIYRNEHYITHSFTAIDLNLLPQYNGATKTTMKICYTKKQQFFFLFYVYEYVVVVFIAPIQWIHLQHFMEKNKLIKYVLIGKKILFATNICLLQTVQLSMGSPIA